MKSRYIYDKGRIIYAEENGQVLVNEVESNGEVGYYVVPDIKPYQSMIDGSMITSRSKHKEHLKAHGCIELGNDSSLKNPVRKPLSSPAGLKETIARQVYEKLHY